MRTMLGAEKHGLCRALWMHVARCVVRTTLQAVNHVAPAQAGHLAARMKRNEVNRSLITMKDLKHPLCTRVYCMLPLNQKHTPHTLMYTHTLTTASSLHKVFGLHRTAIGMTRRLSCFANQDGRSFAAE